MLCGGLALWVNTLVDDAVCNGGCKGGQFLCGVLALCKGGFIVSFYGFKGGYGGGVGFRLCGCFVRVHRVSLSAGGVFGLRCGVVVLWCPACLVRHEQV